MRTIHAMAGVFAMMSALPAAAVTLNPKGLGQALIYPYYTVNKGQDTLVSVVNASDIGKFALVQFREGYNGRAVLEFYLYLSARDTWTAVISEGEDGGAKLVTTDSSCTRPAVPAAPAGLPFTASTYTGTYAAPCIVPDSGPQTIARVREGHLEIIAKGDIAPGSVVDIAITPPAEGEAPPDCASVPAAMFTELAPGNALSGSASIVNVAEGTFFTYGADALAGLTSTAFFFGSGMAEYDMLLAANSAGLPSGATANLSTDEGDPLAIDYEQGIDAVSAVFMKNAIYNDYLNAAALGASTDWIVTFPTKRYYTDSVYHGMMPRAPFTAAFEDGRADVVVGADFHDHGGAAVPVVPPDCGASCPPPLALPYEVNVLSVMRTAADGSSNVLGSRLATELKPHRSSPMLEDAGWISMDLHSARESHALSAGQADGYMATLHGLPVTGFMVYNIINANAAPGRLANYGGAFPHRATVVCWSDAAFTGPNPC